MTKQINVSDDTRELLRLLSMTRRRSMQEICDVAIRMYEDDSKLIQELPTLIKPAVDVLVHDLIRTFEVQVTKIIQDAITSSIKAHQRQYGYDLPVVTDEEEYRALDNALE